MEWVGHEKHFDRELFVLDASSSDDIPDSFAVPCPYFACLIVWDACLVSDVVIRAVANKLLRAGCVYICCWGPDCSRVHDCFDTVELMLRPDGPWAMSTWHKDEPLCEALWFLLACAAPDDAFFGGCRASIGLTVGSQAWAAEVRKALTFPAEYSAAFLASEGD